MSKMRNMMIFFTSFVVIVGLGVGYLALAQEPVEDPGLVDDDGEIDWGYPVNETRLNEFAINLKSGGPAPDGIPPIEDPSYWTVDEANDYLDNADIVFGLVQDGEVYAYPQRILVWHEIVNERFGGSPLSITYCPLTGSAVAFKGNLPGNDTTFGTTGRLVNSNLVMYDRATRSYFPQILSQAINKEYQGLRLERVHLIWTTWAKWKAAYPETLVLSTDTGFVRDYTRDPYGSYEDTNSYYHNNDLLFPLMNQDNRLFEKDVVIGIDDFDGQYAIQKHLLRTEKVVNFEIGNRSYVAFYDENLDTVRTFSRVFEGDILSFILENDTFVDDTDAAWSISGESSVGALTEIVNMDVMWFAWAAYYPNTGLTCTSCG